MHNFQERLLVLSRTENLAALTLRQMAAKIGCPHESPQKIKHHLLQLQRRGFLTIDRSKKLMSKAVMRPSLIKGLPRNESVLFSIPIVGTANCGPATLFAEENFNGFLRISRRLLGRSKPDGLYALKADGLSMNRAELHGKRIEDGDFVIVDSKDLDVRNGDFVVAVTGGRATIKKFFDDRINGQIVLSAESSFDYDPIYLHADDDLHISGKVIEVLKRPKR